MSDGSETKNGELPMMSDGTLRFRVKRHDGAETVHTLDLLLLKLTCERCEEDHQLVIAEGRMQPTADFLQDLASRLAGIGLDGCTPTMAWKAWVAASEEMARLKN